jgi:hypothetical protein
MPDRPFGGDGSRYQNWAGQPAHWWNISYDTHSRAQRTVQGVMRLVYVVVIAVALVLVISKSVG